MYRAIGGVGFGWMRVAVLASLLGLGHTSAWAQEPPAVEVSGGYSFLAYRVHNLPRGVFANAGWRATRRILLLGEAAANVEDRQFTGFGSEERVRTLMGGARLNMPPTRRFEPFVQALAGVSFVDARVFDTDTGSDLSIPLFDIRLDSRDFALQLGGGLTWWMHRRLGVQIEAHYQRTFDRFDIGPLVPGYDANEFGLLAGATIGFGRKS